MASGEVRKVSREDIQLVQNLIERCLQLYMNQKEVIDTLSIQAKIEPSFTQLVHQSPLCYIPQHTSSPAKLDGMICNGGFPNVIMNGRSSGQEGNYLGSDSSILGASMNPSTSMLSAHDSNMSTVPGMNRTIIKSEPNYLNNSEFPFSNDSSILETHQSIGDVSVGSFSSSELTGQPLNDTLLDIDTSTLGFSQIPRNFSFSDLTDDFTHCADILENYDRSPYLPHDSNNFSDSPGRELKEEDMRKLDTISEGVSYEDFGSD
ncbi:uncharacterized protein LOC122038361 isoform X2 [Zingiber officinale]|uniref:uncharacterized protein LOC121984543 isoform X2 n=1 Tax=Zingiber officinale TaxID=94328 RepID=UPI001C4AC067|nr:uncharacterized protein LOC121984543 isoform X2 [Zingiber officinale]XP_042454008.1 uncharacterized protein LOC122038361 isoform X2 [Zingiber officinale]